jgi:hypothetical protein
MMRPIVLMRLGGAFTLYWIVYNTWPVSLLVGFAAVAIWIAVAVGRPARAKTPAATPTATASSKPIVRSRSRETLQRKSIIVPDQQSTSIATAIDQLSRGIASRSGSVFYSGPSAFQGHHPLYILGLNPGGSPLDQADETVERDLSGWKAMTTPWSAYLDESWQGRAPGTHGMQPRMRHMFEQLGLDLRDVPASNVVFVRSTTEAALAAEKASMLPQCWSIHEAVISELGVRTVLCLGGTAGRWVREALAAHQLLDRFSEHNARGWTSEACRAGRSRRHHRHSSGACRLAKSSGRSDASGPRCA